MEMVQMIWTLDGVEVRNQMIPQQYEYRWTETACDWLDSVKKGRAIVKFIGSNGSISTRGNYA